MDSAAFAPIPSAPAAWVMHAVAAPPLVAPLATMPLLATPAAMAEPMPLAVFHREDPEDRDTWVGYESLHPLTFLPADAR